MGFFLGFLGVIIMALMPNKQQQEAQAAQMTAAAATTQAAAAQIALSVERLQANDTIECPRCAETIKRRAKVCRFCGYELPSGFSATPVDPSA